MPAQRCLLPVQDFRASIAPGPDGTECPNVPNDLLPCGNATIGSATRLASLGGPERQGSKGLEGSMTLKVQ